MNLSRFRFLLKGLKRAFLPWPLLGDPARLSCRPFFIISTGRSGSTLLRALINGHPDVIIPPESHALGKIVQNYLGRYRFLNWQEIVRLTLSEFSQMSGFRYWDLPADTFIAQAEAIPKQDRNLARLIDELYRLYGQLNKPEAMRWGDKSMRNSRYLPELLTLFPGAQFLHILRDGRDVVASYRAKELSVDLVDGCTYWQRNIDNIRRFSLGLNQGQFYEIRYEDLVVEPDGVLKSVCDFLDLSFKSHMLNHQAQVTLLGDVDRPLHDNLDVPITPGNVGKWRQSLTMAEQAMVQSALGDTLMALGYGAAATENDGGADEVGPLKRRQ